ncbi:MAG: NusG domain II-containing protein [Zoogloeaceae bacterium]|nr:NusG domain II-containing protein [Zoogloeaceae bacterium]
MRPGDYLTLGLAAAVCVASVLMLWRGGAPDKVVVRAGGQVFAEASLSRAQVIEVPGPLGITRIEIEPGRARVAEDPGLRQYCVRQGWLTRSGATAICAPNQVSLSLSGGSADFDSLNY